MTRPLATPYGIDLEWEELGEGPPLLLLHSEESVASARRLAEELAADHRVLLPSHPGFSQTPRLPFAATVRDVAYVYHEALRSQELTGVTVVGSSLGAWIALELAVLAADRVVQVHLLGPVGIKLGDHLTMDFTDVFAISDEERAEVSYHDPSIGLVDVAASSLADLERAALDREAFTLYAWEPYLHSVALRHHVQSVRAPVHIVSGASDRFVRDGYYGELAEVLGATHSVVDECGHFPEIERPADAAVAIRSFNPRPATAAKR